MTLDDNALRKIMPLCPRARRAQCLPHLVRAMLHYEITTKLRAAAFLATLAVESAEFRYFEELASGAAYEGKRRLGNIYPGDGRKYKGRGAIQVTGRSNCEACLKALGLPAGHPERLAEPEYAFLSAGWFWNVNHLNALADRRQFLQIQVRVNGKNPPNGWDRRHMYYERALLALPDDFELTDEHMGTLIAESGQQYEDTEHPDFLVPPQSAAAEAEAPPLPPPDVPAGDGGAVPMALAPVEGGERDAPPVDVQAAAPAKERTTKSLISTITAAVSSVGLTLGTLLSQAKNWVDTHPTVVAALIIAAVAGVIICYLVYQTRQTKLDLADREHARDVTLETMRIRSDPQRINVQVRPRAVPPDPERVS